MNIPQAIIEKANKYKGYKGEMKLLGKYKNNSIYMYEYSEPVMTGLPELYSWDGEKVTTIINEEAFKVLVFFDYMMYAFYKEKKTDKIYWVDNVGSFGEHLFTFDEKVIFNLFRDYPYKLSKEQKEIFDKENPFWADFFKDRK